jgi:transposase
MSETFSKVEVTTGVARRRRFTTEQKLSVVNETLQPGMSISYVARRHGLSPSLVFRWRWLMSEGGKEAVRGEPVARIDFVDRCHPNFLIDPVDALKGHPQCRVGVCRGARERF